MWAVASSLCIWGRHKKRPYSPQCRNISTWETVLLDSCWGQTLSFIFYNFPKTWPNLIPQLCFVLLQPLASLRFLIFNCVPLDHKLNCSSWNEWEFLLHQIEGTHLYYLWHPSNTTLVILFLNSTPLFRFLIPNCWEISPVYLGKQK